MLIMDKMKKSEGFRGQILHMIPRPILERECLHPLMQSLFISDIGWYPKARHHYRKRVEGAEENILIVCMAGKGWFEVQGHSSLLEAGQALLIPKGVPHRYEADDQEPWSIHWIHFRGSDADLYLRLLPDGEFRLPLAPACITGLEAIFRSATSAIADAYSPANILFLAQLCHHLLGLVFFHNRAYSPTLRAPASHDLQPTVTYIQEHCAEALTRDALARHAGLSVAHFSLLFQRQTGASPMQFLIQQRMRLACRLMDTTSLTIREIAIKAGYDDPYYFSRLFSKTIGHSPREYRKMRKG
jgi:AraC family transcriptional regulator, arabinose operon regulatory protein